MTDEKPAPDAAPMIPPAIEADLMKAAEDRTIARFPPPIPEANSEAAANLAAIKIMVAGLPAEHRRAVETCRLAILKVADHYDRQHQAQIGSMAICLIGAELAAEAERTEPEAGQG